MYKPAKEFMIVEEVKGESSSIVIPENEKGFTDDQLFTIVTLPDGAETELKVGDRVVIVGYLTHYKHAGKKLTLAKIKDVIMTITEE